MKIDISDIKLQKGAEKNVMELVAVAIDDYTADIKLEGKAVNLGEHFIFTGRLSGIVHTYCAKCLKEIDMPYDEEVSFTFINEDTATVLEEALTFQGNVVCLHEVATGIIRADMPIAAYCKEGCKGLCPLCGISLNEDSCSCEVFRNESKFSELKKIFIE